jgi:hypothetical protein
MATIKPVLIQNPYSHIAEIFKWEGMTEADTAVPVVVPHKADKTVQVIGDFGAGGAVDIQGALAPGAPAGDFVTLDDPQGNALSFLANKIEAVLENTYSVAPKVASGAGVSVTVLLLIKN